MIMPPVNAVLEIRLAYLSLAGAHKRYNGIRRFAEAEFLHSACDGQLCGKWTPATGGNPAGSQPINIGGKL
jgi:hypothetical protein